MINQELRAKMLADFQKVMSDPVIIRRSVLEAEMIVGLSKATKAQYYFDLGCWAGLLARDVLDRCDYLGAVLIDANPIAIEQAVLHTKTPVEFLNRVLVLNSRDVGTFRVPIVNDETITSSASVGTGLHTIKSCWIPNVKALSALDFVLQYHYMLAEAYLKMDLEGLDIAFLEELVKLVMPKVIHLEIKDWSGIESKRDLLLSYGYIVPKQQVNHQFWSIAMIRNPDEITSATLGIGGESNDQVYYEIEAPMNLALESEKLVRALLNREKEIVISSQLIAIAEEVISVPEKPEGYYPIFRRSNVPTQPKVVVPVTGGLDSTALFFLYSGISAIPLYLDLRQPYMEKEWRAINSIGIERVEFISMWMHNNYWKHIIPARNLLVLAMAAERIPYGGKILFGSVEGEMPERGGDKSKRFIKLVNDLLKAQMIEVQTPLDTMTKGEIVRELEKSHPGLAQKTISCFSEEPGHCGRCQACLRKWMAFTNNDLELKTNTPVKEGCAEFIDKYKRLMILALGNGDFSKYSEKRCVEDLYALGKL